MNNLKNIVITSFVLLATACAAAPDDVVEQAPASAEVATEDGNSDGVDVDVNTDAVSPEAASNCRWKHIDCCNGGRSSRMAWQCWDPAGYWRNTGTYRCATERACVW